MNERKDYLVVGHINPVGVYPAYVIPVVTVEGIDYAIYLSDGDTLDLHRASDYVRHSPSTLQSTQAYYSKESCCRLFSFNKLNSILYRASEVTDFWIHAINSEQVLRTNPFAAVDIAIDTGQRGCIIAALTACVRTLQESESGTQIVRSWYDSQIRELKRELSYDLDLPESWTELEIEMLLLPELELPGVELSCQRAEEYLSRHEVRVRESRLERRKSRRLVDTLLELTAAACIRQKQIVAWQVFFDYFIRGLHPAAIARNLKLRGVSAVRKHADDAMLAMHNIFAQEQSRNPVLHGMTGIGIQTALASPRIVSRPQGVDIVFCIDVTNSMTPFIDAARRIVTNFYQSFVKAMTLRGLTVSQVQARVIAFRDYYCDTVPLKETSFMSLPQEDWVLRSVVNNLTPEGGGDEPECSLEALTFAIDSQWISGGPDSVHMIMLFTDAPAHRLEKSLTDPPKNYPSGIPNSLDELRNKWELFCSQSSAAVQRLVMFAPDVYPWCNVATEWHNTLHIVSEAGDGLRAMPEELIVESIARGLD